jgi:hypothetical protein
MKLTAVSAVEIAANFMIDAGSRGTSGTSGTSGDAEQPG